MEKERQEYYMALALELSKRALPHCLPNPPVGCVLVRDDVVLATGFTQTPGNFHAEASALAALSESSLRDVSAFVTLEPCSFHGRTPSCALALIESGIGTVYVALRDPDPRNNGKGIELLHGAGITVNENVLGEVVAEFLEPYLHRSTSQTSADASVHL